MLSLLEATFFSIFPCSVSSVKVLIGCFFPTKPPCPQFLYIRHSGLCPQRAQSKKTGWVKNVENTKLHSLSTRSNKSSFEQNVYNSETSSYFSWNWILHLIKLMCWGNITKNRTRKWHNISKVLFYSEAKELLIKGMYWPLWMTPLHKGKRPIWNVCLVSLMLQYYSN